MEPRAKGKKGPPKKFYAEDAIPRAETEREAHTQQLAHRTIAAAVKVQIELCWGERR